MASYPLVDFSTALADAVARVEPSVVQVHGRRRPLSGVVHSAGVVVTSARALGRDDRLRLRSGDGRTFDASLAGWDPVTGLAALRVDGLDLVAPAPAAAPVRVGQLALGLARSWSNALTASAGIVAVVGGPLRTGRRRSIEEVIRTTVPMHEGFAGGPLVNAAGELIGISTGFAIRGFEVAIPARLAWQAADGLVKGASGRRGFLGIAGQTVSLPERQRAGAGAERGLLVVGVTPDSPADQAGLFVGDIVTHFDGQAVGAPDDLLDLLAGDRVGRAVPVALLRGGVRQEIAVTVAARRPGA
jgi:serine protease DegQ